MGRKIAVAGMGKFSEAFRIGGGQSPDPNNTNRKPKRK
jgi:hypothetical protein